MKIEIEISEEDAACIWADHHGEAQGLTVEDIILGVVASEARTFKRSFPQAIERAVSEFQAAQKQTAP